MSKLCPPGDLTTQLPGLNADEEDDNFPLWLPFPVQPDSSPDSVCELVQVSDHEKYFRVCIKIFTGRTPGRATRWTRPSSCGGTTST